MSRFNSEAYDKLFPREPEPVHVESAVDNFTPTKNKVEGKDPDQVAQEDPKQDLIIEDPEPAEPEEDITNGHDQHSEPDTE